MFSFLPIKAIDQQYCSKVFLVIFSEGPQRCLSAAATRLGRCLESDACAAPLAFHSTEDSVQAVLGRVQVSSQHGADILTRSLRAHLVS